MPDPLDSIADPELRQQLRWLRTNYGAVIESERLARIVKGFRSQKGIYKPANSPHGLWVRQTLRGAYPDEEPRYFSDGSWTYRYSPEGRAGQTDLRLHTNRSLLRCMEDRIPIGVMRQVVGPGDSPAYEILGLAYVDNFDGSHFVLRGESIHWESVPATTHVFEVFQPFDEGPRRMSAQLRQLRDQRFGIAVRKAYRDRCSLCEIGYRVRGRVLGLEAAHIIPVGERGNSIDIRNGILLCRNHHLLFDELAWTPDENLRVLIADDDDFRRSAQANCVLDWEGKRLPNLPQQSDLLPAAEALRYRLERFA